MSLWKRLSAAIRDEVNADAFAAPPRPAPETATPQAPCDWERKREERPAFARIYTVTEPWGTLTVERRVNRWKSNARDWWSFATLREAHRDRDVLIRPGEPIADQILRPEIAAAVSQKLAAIEAFDDSLDQVNEFVDEDGVRWRRVA